MSSSTSSKEWPGEDNNPHPEVFTTPPPYPQIAKDGQLTRQQFDQFFQQGYVLVDKFFTDDEMTVLEQCRAGVNQDVENLAQKLYKAGKIKKLYKDYGLFQRLTMIEKEFPGANILLHKLGIMPDWFKLLWSHPKLLNLVEQLLGTADIDGDPNWNLRCKTPRTDAATVPWHQDNGYGSKDAYYQFVLTGWIPFLDSNENNGCMQVMKHGHKAGKVATHTGCWRDTWYLMLDEQEMVKTLGVDLEKDLVTCPVPYGGILLFSNMLPHRSLNNSSNDIRWSVDIRWVRGDVNYQYHGIKNSIPLRRANQPDFKIDWEEFASVDRHKASEENLGIVVDDFDTILAGPWMKKWEMIHRNRHTDAFFSQEAVDQAISSG